MAASKILVIAPFSGDKVAVTKAKKKTSTGKKVKCEKIHFRRKRTNNS